MPRCIQVQSPCPAEVPAHLSASLHRFPFPSCLALLELLNLTHSSPRCVALDWALGEHIPAKGFFRGGMSKWEGRWFGKKKHSLLINHS